LNCLRNSSHKRFSFFVLLFGGAMKSFRIPFLDVYRVFGRLHRVRG
jgi:hypothetical protein